MPSNLFKSNWKKTNSKINSKKSKDSIKASLKSQESKVKNFEF